MNEMTAIFKICWQSEFVYRLNFVLWRVRTVLQFLLVYFIWWSVFQSTQSVFGYSQKTILTYIVVISVIRSIVLSSKTADIMNKINNGSFSNFLTKPIGIIKYYFLQDAADKILNCIFMVCEISIILLIFKPEILNQKNLATIALFTLSVILAAVLWFCINLIIGMMAFWVENSWGPLFLLMIFMEGMGGGLFPIDILPANFYNFLMLTPFPYLLYFPAKLYIGGFSPEQLGVYFPVLIIWVFVCIFGMKKVLGIGLKHYTSEGN
jgi:ABC-2 type transport system permease protein